MTEKTATEASNDFFQGFRTRRQAIDAELLRSATLSKDTLTQHFDDILKQINDLEKDLTIATEYIPSYDERQFSLQLKGLKDKLESTRTALAPKPKFSFKSRKKKADNPKTVEGRTIATNQPTATAVSHDDNTLLTDATVCIKDITKQVVLIKDWLQENAERRSMDILLSNLSYCFIDLRDESLQLSAIHVKDLHHCLICCGNIQGSILVYGLTDSIVHAGCHQLRIHEAHNVDMLLHVSSRPIIEDSHGIQVGCWYLDLEEKNLYDQVEDFNWLKKQASPNWKTMDSDRQQLIKDEVEKANHDRAELLTRMRDLLPTAM